MPTAPANLKPSILDRLVDVSLLGPTCAPWYSQQQAIDAVRADLENLLNTRKTNIGLTDGLPAASDSIIAYGIPDASSLTVNSAEQRHNVAREIAESIRRFEPRLSRVSVTIVEPATRKDRVLRLSIRGRLNIDPAVDIDLSGSLEVTTGRIQMATSP